MRSHQRFLPETRWFGDLQKRRWGLCPLSCSLVENKAFIFFFGYWVCTKPQINAPQLSESFSWLLWSTLAFNRCLRMPVWSRSCLPAEEAGAVRSWTLLSFTGVNGKGEGKMVCAGGKCYITPGLLPNTFSLLCHKGYVHCIGLCPYLSGRVGGDKPPRYNEALNMFSTYTRVIQEAF